MVDPRRVSFRALVKYENQKDAYAWLVNRILMERPNILDNEENRRYICDGRTRQYLARRPEDLWRVSKKHLCTPNHYRKMCNGWYLNTNLDEDTTLKVLHRITEIAGFKKGVDWTWKKF